VLYDAIEKQFVYTAIQLCREIKTLIMFIGSWKSNNSVHSGSAREAYATGDGEAGSLAAQSASRRRRKALPSRVSTDHARAKMQRDSDVHSVQRLAGRAD